MVKDSKRVGKVKAPVLLALVLSTLPGIHAAAGAEGTVATPPAGQVQTAWLDYQEVGYPLIGSSVSIMRQFTPFKKEPDLGRATVIRGRLEIGNDRTNLIAFVLDRAAGKLYLDQNRNLDLTDDAAGTFTASGKVTADYATFTNIHLPVKTASGERQFVVDLTFWLWNDGSRRTCTAVLRSFWQGKMLFAGEEWQVGIVENPFAQPLDSPATRYLLLRPWAARNEPFRISSESPEAFALPRKLFVHQQAWQLECADVVSSNGSRLKLDLTGQQPALGELKITGAFIQRIVLEGEPWTAVLDRPAAAVKIPVGNYSQLNVWLKNGDAAASRNPARRQLAVDENKPVVLAIGGPLTNSVSVTRHGRDLNLSYCLVGAGGEAYQLARQDRTRPPTFAIFKGGRQLAAGKFEFG